MGIDRVIPPISPPLDKIDFNPPQYIHLDNGVPLYWFYSDDAEVIRIEFLFNAGIGYQEDPLVAKGANSNLSEGTNKRTARQIANELDYYGSYVQYEVTNDTASLVLYALTRFVPEALLVVEDVLLNANYPDSELEIYRQVSKQKFLVATEKVSVLAKRAFTANIFLGHSYGSVPKETDFDTLSASMLRKFHRNHYTPDNCTILLAGCLNDSLLAELNSRFGNSWEGGIVSPHLKDAQVVNSFKKFIPQKEALQSAIRIGRPLFNRMHPDFVKLQFLVTLLGGYFGSRLMTNVREDKGYTYGIGSGLASFVHGGYFFISTEVGADVTSKALEEIYKELVRLQTEMIPVEEVDLVRNYIMGQILRSVDGPFAQIDRLKTLLPYGLEYDYLEKVVETIRSVSAVDLRKLANQYLRKEDLSQVVVGKL